MQDKAVTSPRVTPSRNAGRKIAKRERFTDFTQCFWDFRVASLLRGELPPVASQMLKSPAVLGKFVASTMTS